MKLKASMTCLILMGGFFHGSGRAVSVVSVDRDTLDFSYKKTPFNLHDKLIERFAGGSIHELEYDTAGDRRISAYLVIPQGKGPFAAILFGHWAKGTKAEFLGEAKLYARSGAVSLLPAYSWDSPSSPAPNHFNDPAQDLRIELSAVIDMRRSLDLLAARNDVDRDRLAYVGHSFGAQWGAILAAIDGRMKATVLIAGSCEVADILVRGQDPSIVALRSQLPEGQLEAYSRGVSALDAIHFLGRTRPGSVLLQFGNYDQQIDKAGMARCATVAGSRSVIRFYAADHEVSDPEALRERIRWIQNQLALQKSGWQ